MGDDSFLERRYLKALAEGDTSALEGLHALYGERIFRYAYRMLGNRTDAEDATSETFLRVLRRAHELKADGAFRTWLFRIARNLCIDKMRQHKLLELPPEAHYTGTEEKSALRVTVQQALKDLPQEYQDPLRLCDLEDLSAKEAAQVLDISVPALKSRLYRGRRALRDKLGSTLDRRP
ncbi:MAG: sigma-70 family RNA polymerase sigma factor [Fimbriimonadaceae bacterium]|nr:sigma-70 family RNA polymerase sigma factor [Fimbriimonadaceae bacterium]